MARQKRNLILDTNVIKSGDVIGFSGKYFESAVINLATYGLPFYGNSHVALMANDATGRLLLFESTTFSKIPCVIQGGIFKGAQAHFLDDVLKVYAGKIYHYPLYRCLYSEEDARLTQFLMDTIGTPYDMMGAFRTAGVGLSWIESLLRQQDLTSVFCSEWVASALSAIGICPTSNASRWNPNRLIRHLRWSQVLCRPRRLK